VSATRHDSRRAGDAGCPKGDEGCIGAWIGASGAWRDDANVNTPTTEQRRRFEQLCLLRSLYARRGADDDSSVMNIAEIAAHVRVLLAEAPRDAEPDPSAPTV
jgi:hypothetical protein